MTKAMKRSSRKRMAARPQFGRGGLVSYPADTGLGGHDILGLLIRSMVRRDRAKAAVNVRSSFLSRMKSFLTGKRGAA